MFVCMCRSWVPETIDDTTTILKLHKTTEEQNFRWKSYKKFSWDPRATCTQSTLIPVLFFAMQSPVYGACLKWDTNHCLLPSCVAARLSCLPYSTPHPTLPPCISSTLPLLSPLCTHQSVLLPSALTSAMPAWKDCSSWMLTSVDIFQWPLTRESPAENSSSAAQSIRANQNSQHTMKTRRVDKPFKNSY